MNTILDLIPCVMGSPTINENLETLLAAMADNPANVGLGAIMTWAKTIGLCIALGVGANECFQMMLGRRGIDVMKILHIIIISFCITFAGSIANMAAQPGKALTSLAKDKTNGINDEVKALEESVAKHQEHYIEAVRKHLQNLEMNKKAEEKVEKSGLDILPDLEEIEKGIENQLKETALLLETKICEWINLIVRYIGEILFQIAYYGLFVCQSIFLHILGAFAPLMFAISLSPHFKSAWSQWLSKYISITLWSFVAYVCIYYVDFIMIWTLERDIDSYEFMTFEVGADTSGDVNIGAIGMQALGSTCMYIVGLLIGVRALAFVPEVSSWLIPGGVSSGAGASSVSTGMAVTNTAASYAGAAAGVALSGGNLTAGYIGSKVGDNLTAFGNSGSLDDSGSPKNN